MPNTSAEIALSTIYPPKDDELVVSVSGPYGHKNALVEEIQVLPPSTHTRPRHVLEWNMAEISVQIPGKNFNFLRSKEHKQPARQKVIVRNVDREFTAVMGPSGAGKTTLVECLSLRNRNFAGAIHLNGKSPGGDYFTTSALVHQRELLLGFLTTREHLLFHALARMSKHYTKEQIYDRVEEVMKSMNLSKAADTQIGGTDPIYFKKGLSGGERKRLCVATELLESPSILFLDEPTSGLDSVMAETVVHTLREVADDGAIVICSIHGPSSPMVKVFTHLILLTHNGRLAYHGRFNEASIFFTRLGHAVPKAYNPSDFYLRLVSPIPGVSVQDNAKRVDSLVDSFKRSPMAVSHPLPPSDAHKQYHAVRGLKASYWTLIKLNTWRGMLQTSRDLVSVGLWGFVMALMGTIFGVLFFQQASENWRSMVGMCFSVVVAVVFTASVGVMMRFPLEWSVVVREYFSGANTMGPYVIAKYIYDFPNSYAPVLLATCMYWMAGLDPSFVEYLKFTGVMVMLTQTSVAMAMFVSSFSANPSVAMALLPVFLAPMILFSGLLYQRSSVPVYLAWIENFSLVNYGFSSLLGLQIHQLDEAGRKIVLSFTELQMGRVSYNIGMIAVSCLVFYIMTWINLRLRLRSTRDG